MTLICSVILLLVGVSSFDTIVSRDRITIASPERNYQTEHDSVVRAVVIDSVSIRLDSLITLKNVQTLLGRSAIHKHERHGDVNWECYKIRSGADSIYLRLESDEIGGPDHRIMGFHLSRRLPANTPQNSCAPISSVRTVVSDNGLYLGMPMKRLLVIMGTPEINKGGHYQFGYMKHVRSLHEHPYDIGATLVVDSEDGRVVSLRASYAETT